MKPDDDLRLIEFWRVVGRATEAMTRWPALLAGASQSDAVAIRRGIARHVRRIMSVAEGFLSGSREHVDLDADLDYLDEARLLAFAEACADLLVPAAEHVRDERQDSYAKVADGMRGLITAGRAFLEAKPAVVSGRMKFKPPVFEDDNGAR